MNTNFFHDPSNKFLNSFYQHGELQDFPPDIALFRQNQPVRYLCLLKRGFVKRYSLSDI